MLSVIDEHVPSHNDIMVIPKLVIATYNIYHSQLTNGLVYI